MKLKQAVIAAALGITVNAPAQAQEVLTGDTRLACEAILCLATGQRPSECAPSLSRYFSIQAKKWEDTLRGRIDFLNLCPASSMDSNMSKLVNDIGNGAGRCDAGSLNATNTVMSYSDSYILVYINNNMPSYCTSYTQNAYTDLKGTLPLYVGIPERGGFWVEPAQYNQALADYNARIAAEDAARLSSW